MCGRLILCARSGAVRKMCWIANGPAEIRASTQLLKLALQANALSGAILEERYLTSFTDDLYRFLEEHCSLVDQVGCHSGYCRTFCR